MCPGNRFAYRGNPRMKNKVTVAALVVSVLLNAAAVVLLICFFKLQSTYHVVLDEKERLQSNFAAIQAGTLPVENIGSNRISKRTFASHLDAVEDYYAVLPPSVGGKLDNTLVVYLHGMGSNYMEPFLNPQPENIALAVSKRYGNVCFLSCNYRKEASCGSDEAMADITQNIRELVQQYPIDKIVLMGTSMGGCTALSYAALAPEDIQKKLRGVVSCEGAGDWNRLCQLTSEPLVKNAIVAAMGGTESAVPEQYKRKSFLANIRSLPKSARVAVISAKQDTIVPPELQAEIVAALQKENYPVTEIAIDAAHGIPPSSNYVQGLEYVLGQ